MEEGTARIGGRHFRREARSEPVDPSASPERLSTEIRRLKLELDWLEKILGYAVAAWIGFVSPPEPLTLTRQCALTGVTRSTLYAPHPAATLDEQELTLLGLIDAEYTRHPFYGSRKIQQYLRGVGHQINRKRVQRLMGVLGLAGMAPGPNTSRPHPQHTVHPYLLRGVVEGLEPALQIYGTPESFNTDQGCQFTSAAFTDSLKAHGIVLSRDGRGRALDNIFVERLWRSVTYEDVYLRGSTTMSELQPGLTDHVVFYTRSDYTSR